MQRMVIISDQEDRWVEFLGHTSIEEGAKWKKSSRSLQKPPIASIEENQ